MNCPKCSRALIIDQCLRFTITKCVNRDCYDHLHVQHLDCCTKPDLNMVRYIISNGVTQIRNQCRTCGRLDGKSIGGISHAEKAMLPLLDDAMREKSDGTWQEVYAIRAAYLEESQTIRRGLWMDRYTDYLNSKEWKAKRLSVLDRDKHLCQSCLTNKASQVHHRSYEFVDFSGMEPCFDLVAICIACHDRLHSIRNQKKAS